MCSSHLLRFHSQLGSFCQYWVSEVNSFFDMMKLYRLLMLTYLYNAVYEFFVPETMQTRVSESAAGWYTVIAWNG